ncbi:g10753 [Coccomyxa elongata]
MDTSIDTAIESLKLEDITAAAPGTTQASHRIARIHPPHWRDGNFGQYNLSFLSTDIEEKVAVKMLQIVANDLSRLMILTSASGACLNESLTHPQLKAGGAWQKRLCPPKGKQGAC